MIDGIYTITFRGAADWGMGMLIFKNAVITGADVTGVQYDGSYVESNNLVKAKIKMIVPPGVTLVQGSPAQPIQYEIPFEVDIPILSFENQSPVLIHLPPGPVNVIFTKLRVI